MATTIVITDAGQCTGTGHIWIEGTVNGVAKRRAWARTELLDSDDNISIEERFLLRVRSAILESGATTPAQARTAILGKTYKV